MQLLHGWMCCAMRADGSPMALLGTTGSGAISHCSTAGCCVRGNPGEEAVSWEVFIAGPCRQSSWKV